MKGIEVELGPLHRHFLENHVILGQCPCLVSQKELDASKFFRNGRISRNCIRHALILVDAVGVEHFGEVEINAERNRNYCWQKQDKPEKVDVPLSLESVKSHDPYRHSNHKNAEELGQPIDFEVQFAHLGPLLIRVHLRSRLLSRVDDECDHKSTRGEHSILPEGILEGQPLSMLTFFINSSRNESFEVIDLIIGWISVQF